MDSSHRSHLYYSSLVDTLAQGESESSVGPE